MRVPSRRTSRFRPILLVAILIIGGGTAFWFGLRAFRAQARERSDREQETMLETTQNVISSSPALSAFLFASSGGGEVGQAKRIFDGHTATIDVFVTLPSIDGTLAEYHVWLVKDGLADVVDMGALVPRLDGTWTGTFSASPATGIVDAVAFSRIVIMLEPLDGNSAPSGMKICEGKF